MIITHWTGGVHCCFNAYVFSLGDVVRKVAFIEGSDFGVRFVDPDGDGVFEVVRSVAPF